MTYLLKAVLCVIILVVKSRTIEDSLIYTPKNFCVRLTTNKTALIQWVEPVTIRTEIMGYTLYYTRDAELPLKEWNSTTIGNSPLTTIRDIELGQVYSFRVQVRSLGLDGPGPLSDLYHFKMSNRSRSCYDHPKTLQIKTLNFLRASATSHKSVEVWWNLMYDPHHVTGFQIFYGLEGSNNWKYKLVGLTQSAELTGLEEGANYTITIAAVTISGMLDYYSQEITVKVQPEDVPLNLKVSDIRPDSMILEWSPPTRFYPVKYKIAYDAVKDFIDSTGIRQHFRYETTEEYVDGGIKAYALRNLMPYTNYNINISAIPIDYSYRPAVKITARTDMAAPNPMTKPDIFGVINGDNIQILLPKASEEYGPVSYYYVVVVPETPYVDLPSKIFSTEELLENEWEEGEDINTPYITAKFSGKIPYAFILGGPDHGGFKNHKLNSKKRYRVFLRAVVITPNGDLFTDSPYSDYISLDSNKMKTKLQPFNVI
ncbi:hypothetical protein ILUMI_12590 [Ignelater luminosus]|uniref:Fibronectin type-III domain-containing protein n=1 Tax=Ignelater luminosus TaxID=2038154 RepID=A0A8K0CZA3_IGNLU|nr:hypothetical protein ILUMI_12590 [Ignelater luminosus]